MIRLTPSGILANELTTSFRLKSNTNATLFRYGYAHTGVCFGSSLKACPAVIIKGLSRCHRIADVDLYWTDKESSNMLIE